MVPLNFGPKKKNTASRRVSYQHLVFYTYTPDLNHFQHPHQLDISFFSRLTNLSFITNSNQMKYNSYTLPSIARSEISVSGSLLVVGFWYHNWQHRPFHLIISAIFGIVLIISGHISTRCRAIFQTLLYT